MVLKLTIDINNPPLSGLAAAHLINESVPIDIIWGKETSLLYPNSNRLLCRTNNDLLRALARLALPTYELYGKTPLERTQIDHWLSYALTLITDSGTDAISKSMNFLNKSLGPVTYLVSNKLTIADLALYNELHIHYDLLFKEKDQNLFQHVLRWYDLIGAQSHIEKVLQSLPDEAKLSLINKKKHDSIHQQKENYAKPISERKQEGKFVDLPGAEMGKVVVRFPPEASGYLHIGHAKAALLNQYYAQAFKGKLIMRFDDTNPAKETVEFETVILEDLKLLQIEPDEFTHTSNYFQLMLQYCEQLIHEGKAYVDDTLPEQMKIEREQKIESPNRKNDIDKNLSMWQNMLKGTEYGQKCCVRAKIDMSSPNGCMRDPTIYRCKNEPHPRTGTKYKVYPTYDFACPIVDAIENVTHTLRTMEYHDRDEQFYWFIDALKLRKPYIWEYSRLNMTNTVLSKRKLTWFVESDLVDGWDDPRFPTVRGIIRRGMTVEGLKEFIIAQGSSKSVVFMNWDKIWAFNKKVIDPLAPRYTALDYENRVIVNVNYPKNEQIEVPMHPKNGTLGTKRITIGPKLYIDYGDAEALKEGENATFINWGNLKIVKIYKNVLGRIISVDASLNLEDKDYKKTLKLTWLAVEDGDEEKAYPPTYCVYFDHIISKAILTKDEDFRQYIGHKTREEFRMLGDPELKKCKKGDIIQLQRRGFFKVDCAYAPASAFSNVPSPLILFSIPDGHTKDMPSSGLKISNQANISQDAKKATDTEVIGTKSAQELFEQIVKQGNFVRDLKSKKADKSQIDVAVGELLDLKNEYKSCTGQDWKPETKQANISNSNPKETTMSNTNTNIIGNNPEELLDRDIRKQGDLIRELKSKKTTKSEIADHVKILLELKAKYKQLTGKDWKPDIVIQKPSVAVTSEKNFTPTLANVKVEVISTAANVESNKIKQEKNPELPSHVAVTLLLNKIQEQGNKIRRFKAEKVTKSILDDEVKLLLALKEDFKSLTGLEWKPDFCIASIVTMKSTEIDLTHSDNDDDEHPPTCIPSKAPKEEESPIISLSEKELLTKEIAQQGEKVRTLKANKVPKEEISTEVMKLLALKAKYKEITGVDFPAASSSSCRSSGSASKKSAEKKISHKTNKKGETAIGKVDSASSPIMVAGTGVGLKKQTRLGLEATKEENLPEWYSQVITKAELIEYYDISGCYILRPWSFAIWKFIKNWFDAEITKMGIRECYFPIFVSKNVLEKEKTHLTDFSPEVAWVTKSGDSDLAEPIAIRPTSETVMYPAFAKWIQSYRDLPIRLNQWNNVVRWEFKHPQPFLRTREFLWQEGHTAFAHKEDADKEVLDILELYAYVYTNLLAIPVIKGRKTEKEKFAGADYTTTVEAFISASGRAIQGATSHHLSQNFSKMFDIVYEDPETQQKKYVYQNSWGMTTRTIGVMIMVHADNQGLLLPPKVACTQAIIVPCGITVNTKDTERNELINACQHLEQLLNSKGIRCEGDYRDNYSPGWKFNHWELKGVPLRIELGPKDMKANQIVAVRRDTGEKLILAMEGVEMKLRELLKTIQDSMLAKAKTDLANHTKLSRNWPDFCNLLDQKNIILAPFCGEISCEEKIKSDSARDEDIEPGAPSMGAKSLCIPFEQPAEITISDKCVHPSCMNKPKYFTLFGRSY